VTDTPKRPHFGFTKHHGFAVHARSIDHMPEGTAYQRFNKRVAIWLTKNVGSMTAFWVFSALALTVAPSCLYAAGYIDWKSFITSFGFELLATLILSTWLELALMPAIMVGQNIAAEASDARAAKQFEDLEEVRDWLDLRTAGGLAEVLKAVQALGEQVAPVTHHTTTLVTLNGHELARAVQKHVLERAANNLGGGFSLPGEDDSDEGDGSPVGV
jgi:hypothetical protein